MPDGAVSKRDQAIVVFHGAIVLLIGSFFGFPVVNAAESGSTTLHAWTSAHAAVTAGGVMLIALGAALHLVTLGSRAQSWLLWSLVGTGYGAVVGLGIGLVEYARMGMPDLATPYTMYDRNDMALIINMALPLVLWFMLEVRQGWAKFLAIAVAVLGVAAVIATTRSSR